MKAARLLIVTGCVIVLGASAPVFAQMQDLELTVYGGYNLGGGIDVRENSVVDLNTSDSFATGASLTWQRSPSHAFELFWGWRATDIEGKESATAEATKFVSLNEHDFHANFLFMPAYRESEATPFLLLGLGATLLDPGELPGVELDSATKFSWAIGAGVKTSVNERFGLRGQVRYHSTYISDESGGTWCDPWYGCYETVDTNWLDEWDFTGGVILQLGS
jgi:opacity protein-like surface antigen